MDLCKIHTTPQITQTKIHAPTTLQQKTRHKKYQEHDYQATTKPEKLKVYEVLEALSHGWTPNGSLLNCPKHQWYTWSSDIEDKIIEVAMLRCVSLHSAFHIISLSSPVSTLSTTSHLVHSDSEQSRFLVEID
jgi:hypothetical protein